MTENYKSPCQLPTPHEDELLKQTIEECAEVIHRISKLQRFGWAEIQTGQHLNNSQRLSAEIGNLLQMIDELQNIGFLDMRFVDLGREEKKRKLPIYRQFDK